MSDIFWEHLKMPPKMGLLTSVFKQAYDNRHLSDSEVLARESCQNSKDAGNDIEGLTQITFQEVVVKDKEKTALLQLFKINSEFIKRFENVVDKKRDNHFLANFQEFIKNNELKLLIISDKNTCGLGGEWNASGPDDHFGRLIISLGIDDKAVENDFSGGSHGLGKTAYSRVSKIETTFFYSCFRESDTTDGANKRLMGVGIYPKHHFQKDLYTGFSFFGMEKDGIAEPVVNDHAEELAEKLKVQRPKNEFGTDVIIIDPIISLESIKESVEKYWWPALIKNQIHVEFINSENEITYPSPKEREDLIPFINCSKDAKSSKSKAEGDKEVFYFNQIINHKPGVIALRTCDAEFVNGNRIAITRGTGMIIDYLELGTDQYPPAIAYFEAHPDILKYLISSENPSHCVWEATAKRLAKEHPKNGKLILDRVNSVLKNRIRDFQKSLVGKIISQPSSQGLMSKLLGKCLSGSRGGVVPPGEPNPRPCSLSIKEKSRTEDKLIYSINLSQNEETPEEDFDLTIKPSLWIIGDFSLTSIKTTKELIVKDKLMRIIKKGTFIEITEKFSKGKNLQYTIEIEDAGDIPYRLICNCDAKIEKGKIVIKQK